MLDLATNIARAAQGLVLYSPHSKRTISAQLTRHARRTPERVFLRFEQQCFTYAQADALINRHAHAYRALGIGPGDTIAMVMENRPSFVWHVLGLHRIGAVPSLINTNLSGHTLTHALRVCEPRLVLAGGECWQAVAAAIDPLRECLGALAGERGAVWVDREDDRAQGEPTASSDAGDFASLLRQASEHSPERALRPSLRDLAVYIYTSGTTGLPKAALVPHHRLYRAGAVWSSLALRYRSGDVMYCCLPLYHSNALLLALGSVITAGATIALARKFSRSRFWDDARMHGTTHFIYIGELCRYLMNTAPSSRDREHRVRGATGNGLRPDIWSAFRERFGVRNIVEFYASTEGNCITLNPLGIVGSVGPMLPGMELVRWDEAAQSIVRDAADRPIRASTGETGLLLGRIGEKASFDGYRDRKATEQKVLRDLFEPGDAYFNTGDLMRRDRLRRLYFVDRVGDTFRWKGENVSTTEVQEAISSLPGVAEVNAYGVRIAGTEGRAGMVALVMNGKPFDADAFKTHVDAALPGYARPLLVRVSERLDTTATFKLKKQDLQEQGFDPARVQEPLYVRHPKCDAYLALSAELHAEIASGALQL